MEKFIARSIEYGLYLFLFLLPWQTRWIFYPRELGGAFYEYGSFSLYLTDILAILILLFSGIFFSRQRKTKDLFSLAKYWYAIILLDLAAFVSIFFATDTWLAIYRYLGLLLGIGIFSLLINFPFKKSWALISLSLSVLIQSGIAFYQFFSQDSLESKWLGMARHIPYDAGVSVVEAMGNLGFVERWMRAYGSLPHPNMLGGFLAMSLILVVSYHVYGRKRDWQTDSEDYSFSKFIQSLLFRLTVVFSGAALFLSFSRSAWLAAFLFLGLFLFILILKRDLLSQKFLLPLVLSLGVILFFLSYPFSNLIESRIEARMRIEQISSHERASSTEQAILAIKEDWLIGKGIGNYTLVASQSRPDQPAYNYQPAHNSFLLLWAEIGIIGIIAFIFLLLSVFLLDVSAVTLAFRFPILIALGLLLYFDHWFWSLHFGVLFLFALLGLARRLFSIDEEPQDVV